MRFSKTRQLTSQAVALRRVCFEELFDSLSISVKPEKPTVCVTGASGYLASELVGQLLDSGRYKVRGTVRSLSDTLKIDALMNMPGANERLELVEADMLQEASFDGVVEGCSLVFHTASPFVTSGVVDPQTELIDPAVKGTRKVMEAAVGAGVDRVVLTSSVAAVMGTAADKVDAPFDEDDWNYTSKITSDCGLDLYRLSKKLAEEAAWEIACENQLELSTVLPSFMIGPPRTARASGESVANMKALLEGKTPPRADTPVADVRDVALAHILAAEVPKAAGQRFIISTPNAVRMADVALLIANQYPWLNIVDMGNPEPLTREIFRSKTVGSVIPLELTPHEHSLLDMASAMMALGSARPDMTCELQEWKSVIEPWNQGIETMEYPTHTGFADPTQRAASAPL